MAKQRDPVLDSMRGIGIVLMVLGHSGFPGTDFIYLFHMALFFMLSGWLFSLRGGPVHFIKRKVVTLWLPFVLANTAFTALNNLFLKLNVLKRLLHGADTLLPQGLFSGVLLWVGWRCGLAGWNVWGLGIAASCYCLFYLGTVLRRTTRESIPAYRRGIFAAAAFAVLLILGQLGSVGLAGNGYSHPIFLLVASLAGWVLVREAACLTAPLPCVRAVLAYLGRATMPIVILHFLSFKLVTWLGLLATGGEPYLLAAFPIYFTGGAWWLAYTAAGLALPLAANAVYRKMKRAFSLGGRWPKAG